MPTETTTPARTNTEDWFDLERERRTLEARLKNIVSKQDWLRQHILERWSMDGVSSEKVEGYTVHLRRSLYPKPADPARLAIALREEGLTDLLTVDTKALGVWLDAHEDSGVPLPESVKGLIGEPFERFALAVKLK
jgi:hypothetical protein